MVAVQAHLPATYSELESFRAPYEALWAKSAIRWPNTTWEWLAAWWKHLRGEQQLLLEVKADGATVGFAPFVQTQSGLLSSRRLTVPSPGLIDYADFLSAAGYEDGVIESVAAHLASADTWDTLAVEQLRWTPEHIQRFSQPFQQRGHPVEVTAGKQTWIAELNGTWDDLLIQFGSRWREHTRRIIRKVEKAQPAYFLAETEGDCLRLLRRLYEMREMKATDAPVDVSRDPYYQFHHAVVPDLLKKGLVYLYGLSIQGELSAVVYGLRYGGAMLYYLPGYDRRTSNLSPGTALTAHMMQDAIRRDVRTFDFGRGDEEYKQHWLATPHPTTEIRITASRLSSQFRIFGERVVRKVKRTLR